MRCPYLLFCSYYGAKPCVHLVLRLGWCVHHQDARHNHLPNLEADGGEGTMDGSIAIMFATMFVAIYFHESSNSSASASGSVIFFFILFNQSSDYLYCSITAHGFFYKLHITSNPDSWNINCGQQSFPSSPMQCIMQKYII